MARKLNVRRTTVLLVGILAVCALVFGSSVVGQNRPRTTPAATPAASPTPTPTPQTQRPVSGRPTLGEPPPVPKLKPTPTPTPPEEIEEGDKIKINADLVQLHVRVIDRNNRPINNVPQGEFHVFEDGVAQPIESFTREEVPISYGLAVDTSGSLRSQLPTVIEAGKSIINSNKSGDETFLVRFVGRDNIETVQDFTANKELLGDGLDNMFVEGGQTAIIDAVYVSAEHVSEYRKGDDGDRRRRALIVITDGEDRNSFYNQEQLFARLREDDVQIFVIGFVNELDKEAGFIRKSPRDKAVNLINKLAEETGGRAFFPESLSELPQIANEIIRDLRTQYVISYNPTNKTPDGTYRAIKVTVDQPTSSEKRIALTRTGRLARREGVGAPKAPPVRLPTAGKTKP
ncbi:MAG TPA: VWA domain-containing protein [Pyrinomonadaceae bacterium]|nr:VWA domain-containing protein [Pyrinomonadaceae bacterium]